MSRAAAAGAAPRQPGREVELSLVIVAPDPESVVRRLARLRRLGGYTLHARGAENLVDRYYDLADRALRKRGLALRLRTVDGAALIGVKGPRRSASTKTEDRLERELSFSAAAVAEIGRRIGVTDRGDASAPLPTEGPEALLRTRLGVEQIQLRETVRLVRDVVEPSAASGPVLAEFVLDHVHFRLAGRDVRHYEIEVEAKRTGRGTQAAKEIVAELTSRYPEELQAWPYGKLPTGVAIEELLSAGELEVGRDGVLAPAAYERIRHRLERETAG